MPLCAQERIDAALGIAYTFAQVDGAHHKMWVIDQMIRKLLGSNKAYKRWVHDAKLGDDGPDTYDWDEGIEP